MSNASRIWSVSVITEKTTDDGYTGSVCSPTFFLFGDVQGITDDAGAERLARNMFERAGCIVRSVMVCETSYSAHGGPHRVTA